MNRVIPLTASNSRAAGKASLPAAAALALAVLVGIGATQTFSRHGALSQDTVPVGDTPATSQPFASQALQVAPDAETYSADNPQPPTF